MTKLNDMEHLDLILVGLVLMKLAGIGDVAEMSWWLVLFPVWLKMAAGVAAFFIEAFVVAIKKHRGGNG